MPRAGERLSVKIEPDVYEKLIKLKHGRDTVSDVIARLLKAREQEAPRSGVWKRLAGMVMGHA